LGGFNGIGNVTAWKTPGVPSAGAYPWETARPASLLRKSILDIGQQTSAAAGCTATYKLRASRVMIKTIYISITLEEKWMLAPDARR
jgi:hypothetical protein